MGQSTDFLLDRTPPRFIEVRRTDEGLAVAIQPRYDMLALESYRLRRISPLFPFRTRENPRHTDAPPQPLVLAFVFVYDKHDFLAVCSAATRNPRSLVYLTLGNPELVLSFYGEDALEIAEATRNEIEEEPSARVEMWLISKDGLLQDVRASKKNSPFPTAPSFEFSPVASQIPLSLSSMSREVFSLMVRRSLGLRALYQDSHIGNREWTAQDYVDHLARTLGKIAPALSEDEVPGAVEAELWKFSGVHTYNVTQRFSGVSPILDNPCPVGGHEALGMGLALRACKKFGRFIFDRFASQRYQEALANLLESQGSPTPLALRIPQSTETPEERAAFVAQAREIQSIANVEEFLPATSVPREKQAPLLHFFSARSGFQFDGISVSIPTTVIPKANSLQWSLMSLTHEYCHAFAGAVVERVVDTLVSGDAALSNYVRECGDSVLGGAGNEDRIWRANSPVQLLTHAILASGLRGDYERLRSLTISELLTQEFREENEIMTIALDQAFFFRGDLKRLLETYWAHWLAIPSLVSDNDRLASYLVRSACAVFAKFMDNPSDPLVAGLPAINADALLRTVRSTLSGSIGFLGPQMQSILERLHSLDDSLDDFLRDVLIRISLALPLVLCTHALLVSENCRQELWRGYDQDDEKTKRPRKTGVSQSVLRAWNADLSFNENILLARMNPLELVHYHSVPSEPAEADSVWLFYMLDVVTDGY